MAEDGAASQKKTEEQHCKKRKTSVSRSCIAKEGGAARLKMAEVHGLQQRKSMT